jgi:hypothetical protein
MCTTNCTRVCRISVLRIATCLPSLPASSVLHAHLMEHLAAGGAAAALVPGSSAELQVRPFFGNSAWMVC